MWANGETSELAALWNTEVMALLERANHELQRGIDEQATRHNGRLVVTGLLSAASVAATAQMLATGAGSPGPRWAVAVMCCLSLLLSTLVWQLFRSYDVDPSARLEDALQNSWDDEHFLDEIVVRRLSAYIENDRQLSEPWRLGLFVGAVATSLLTVAWALFIAVGPRPA
jgi:cytochrome c-type biogenesis protein CcmH/NrfG